MAANLCDTELKFHKKEDLYENTNIGAGPKSLVNSRRNSEVNYEDLRFSDQNVDHQNVYAQLPRKTSAFSIKNWNVTIVILMVLCIGLVAAFISVLAVLLSRNISPCTGIECLYNGTCFVSGDYGLCNCKKGFYGSRCETTPCANMTCHNGGTCYIQAFQPRCACQNGFTGRDCSITPCTSAPCLHNGNCSYNIGSSIPQCSCMGGFAGTFCEITPCSSSPCQNKGTCGIAGSEYRCYCDTGFSGSNCQLTPCSTFPCTENGTCTINDYGYICFCEDGYCTKSPCSSSPCRNGGTCSSINNRTFACRCRTGFFGIQCENYFCDLDNDTNCMFIQDLNDDYDWTRLSGRTPSHDTGPSSAYEGNYYFYFETSKPVSMGDKARLISRGFGLKSEGCLKFYYHMYGSAMGTLNVYQEDTMIWSQNGNKGNSWFPCAVNLTKRSNEFTRITFEAIRGNGFTSDIAIDDIHFYPTSC